MYGGKVMKAMIVDEPRPIGENPLAVLELPERLPERGEVRLRVLACGVCHTDLHIAEGDLPPIRRPLVPGHQIVGAVEQIGSGVNGVEVGDRMGVTWLGYTDTSCHYCLTGRENLCDNARFTGYHTNGGYAEQVVANADFLVPIPEALSEIEAAPLLCAGIIGYRSLRLSEIRPRERLGLFGFGTSAHLAIQVARHWGCEVYAFSRGEEHRQLALKLGAVWAGGAEDEPPEELDAAITFAPAGRLALAALAKLRKGGTLAINAIHMSPIPEMNYELLYGERTLRSVTNLTRLDAREFLEVAAEIPVEAAVEVFALQEANEALRRLKEGEIEGAAVLIP
jgi:alcohol dehydrogenase, propanol-preferring